MARLILLLLGVDYLRQRAPSLIWIGAFFFAFGLALIVEAIGNAVYFPLRAFAWLFLVEGVATLTIVGIGVGGQRIVRAIKGGAFTMIAILVLFFNEESGNFWLSMLLGTAFLADGALQSISAYVVRYPHWVPTFAGGIFEIMIAFLFYLPYPIPYKAALPYAIGLGLLFTGWNVFALATRTLRLRSSASVDQIFDNQAKVSNLWRDNSASERDGTHEQAAGIEPMLTVHVWTPSASAKAPTRRQPLIDRYIAAVDRNGVISTGHAALESHVGIYISLYPAQDIDRSPEAFGQILRATSQNNVPGEFQPNYAIESNAWCESTVKVRIRNYNAKQLAFFWQTYQQNTTYNLTYRNCSSSVAHALDAAVEGRVGSLYGAGNAKWWAFVRLWITPELWVAAQLRKRAETMAWTPGLVLDYARAISMLVDPRPFGWVAMSAIALRRIRRARHTWHQEEKAR